MTFDEVYAAHSRKVLGQVRRIVGVEHAEDCAQQVWMRVYHSLSSFRGTCAITTWLYRVAFTAALDYKRDLRRRGYFGEPLENFDFIAPIQSPEMVMLLDEKLKLARCAIQSLPPEHRQVLRLTLRGYGPTAIAQQIGVNYGTVKSRLHRAKTALTS